MHARVQVRLEQIFHRMNLETSVNFAHPFIYFTKRGVDSAYPEQDDRRGSMDFCQASATPKGLSSGESQPTPGRRTEGPEAKELIEISEFIHKRAYKTHVLHLEMHYFSSERSNPARKASQALARCKLLHWVPP